MVSRKHRIRDPHRVYEELGRLMGDLEYLVKAVVVEGPRDVEALRRLSFRGRVETFSRVSMSDADFVESLAHEVDSVVILTDFDEEGRRLNNHLTNLFERRGVKVETGLRRQVSRLMAILGIYAVEALDNATLKK